MAAVLAAFFLYLAMAPGVPAATPAPAPAASATLGPHGGAYVTTLPGAASAWLDGIYVGSTPFYADDLLPGTHAITLSSAGWQPVTATFDVSVGRITPVSIVMSRAPAGGSSALTKGQGLLSVTGVPAGTKVYVDGVGLGTAPLSAQSIGAGYHIVTVQPPGPGAARATRVVDVYPNVTSAVIFARPTPPPDLASTDDILEPVESVVDPNAVAISGVDVIIHFHGNEIQCAIGSRSYRFNGREGTLAVPPALVAGKLYLPQSLLARLSGTR